MPNLYSGGKIAFGHLTLFALRVSPECPSAVYFSVATKIYTHIERALTSNPMVQQFRFLVFLIHNN